MRDYFDKILPAVFWPLLIVIITWVCWVVVAGRDPLMELPTTVANGPTEEIPPAIVDKPILEEVSADGSVTWTLYLDKIIREVDSVMELDKPRALYRLKSGEILEVTGELGTYDETRRILTLTGDVNGYARESKFNFSVDEMQWDSNTGLITASGEVEVFREGLLIRGFDLKIELSEEFSRLELSGINETTGEVGSVVVTTSEEVLEGLDIAD